MDRSDSTAFRYLREKMAAETKVIEAAIAPPPPAEQASGELLPLPKPPYIDEHNLHGGRLAYSIQQMKDYARANVERALAESRAEVERWKAEAIDIANGAGEIVAAAEARAERLAEAGRRVTAAFRALGETPAWTRAAVQAHHECEAAMLALDAALNLKSQDDN